MTVIKLLLGKYLTAIEIALLALALGFGAFQTVRLERARAHVSDLNARAATLQAERSEQRAIDERHARAVEGQLRDTAAAIQKDSHETERTLRARADALARELRNRPDRPATGSEAAATSAASGSGTGAGLYRPDAAFLVGEAARAADIARERDLCVKQYRSAEESLK